jgi:NADH-dependent peroxiredoxin subunit F
MLIVGGGPAGAAAAVYAARKGIRTGVVAERFGGQTLDTLGIENYPSVLETQGPKFAAALEAQMQANDVDIMNGQRVAALEGAPQPGGLLTLRLENGAELKARSVVLATGARWRASACPARPSTPTRAWPTARTATARCSRAKRWPSSAAATRVSRRRSTSPASCST